MEHNYDYIKNFLDDDVVYRRVDKEEIPYFEDTYCDYCEKSYSSKEIRPILESKTTHSYKSNLLGAYIEKETKLYTTHICKRCNKIHKIADSFHFILFLVLAGIVIYDLWTKGERDYYDYYPVAIVALLVYIINIINWVFIKWIFHVRRKPRRV